MTTNHAEPAAVTGSPTRLAPQRTRDVVAKAARLLFEDTPGRLRLYGLFAATSCLLFGVLAFVAASSRADALSNARGNAAQLVRIQAIRTDLVLADANFTNSFLVGGLESQTSRLAYEQGIKDAARMLAEAAGQSAYDAEVLGKVNDVITRYTGLVESARANNRQGYPVGEAFLRQATNLLRANALSALENLGAIEQQRVDDYYSTSARATTWLAIGIASPLAALVVVQVRLSARTRRLLNLPLVCATASILICGAVLIGFMVWSQSKAVNTREHTYFATVELTTARIDAFDAESLESLTLISRGSGQSYEAQFKNLADNTKAILEDAAARGDTNESDALHAFASYDGIHMKIREYDDNGNWDQAVTLATGDGYEAFQTFNTASREALERRSDQVDRDLGDARAPLRTIAWLAMITAVASGAAAVQGIATRLREYR